MIKTIVELVLSEACNFNLMYTVMEVAVEQSGIFKNLCLCWKGIFNFCLPTTPELILTGKIVGNCSTNSAINTK